MSSPDPPALPPPPVMPSEDPKVKAQRMEAERQAMKAKGRSATLLTQGQGQGIAPPAPMGTASAMLLGS